MNLLPLLGLTPEAIRRHVVRVEPPLTESEINGLLVKQCQARRRNAKQKLNTTKQ
jgi:hypothetical protein